ncbi:MAG: tRNA glutamyl-Q(34) synthetase GluQRS [Gammaproteobacteria bacterium]
MKSKRYVGRFAPSPSGPLHYGSLVAATASYLQAKHNNGKWLLRIEDIDPPREVPGAATNILKTLEHFQFEWDETPLYQSTRHEQYRTQVHTLIQHDKVYACSCSRKDLVNDVQKSALGKRYPGTCENRKLDLSNRTDFNLRLRVDNRILSFSDSTYGEKQHNLLKEIGDIILYRKFDLPSYAIAVTVDDAYQEITEVVRGYDLLAFTPIQIYLSQLLNFPTPNFLHVPIIVNSQQQKLSKQTGAKAVNTQDRCKTILRILKDLGQNNSELEEDMLNNNDLTELWSWSIEHWNADNIPKTKHVYMS